MKRTLQCLACLALLGPGSPATADDAAEPSAAEIVQRAADRPQGHDSSARAVWRTRDDGGREQTLETRMFRRDASADGGELASQWLIVVEAPAAVRDVGLLVLDRKDGSTEQWLYLPAFRKTRRLEKTNQGESFLGSEFTFEDLREHLVADETHVLVRREERDGARCAVIESTPRTPNPAYASRRTWVDLQRWTTPRVEFIAADGKVARTFEARWKEVSGVLVWESLEMKDERTGRRSRIELSEQTVDTGLAPELFTQTALLRGVR